jgi:hypothetical protein
MCQYHLAAEAFMSPCGFKISVIEKMAFRESVARSECHGRKFDATTSKAIGAAPHYVHQKRQAQEQIAGSHFLMMPSHPTQRQLP